jgi:hypothetical protein
VQAFHFVSANHGLEDIRRRRIKVATLAELNDPFELMGADLGDPTARKNLSVARESIGKRMGLLCFSRHWHNPVLWGHYADRHRGLCLGFDVADEDIRPVTYASRRFALHGDPLKPSGAPDQESVAKLMLTKYAHWRYEAELRAFVALDSAASEDGMFFSAFGVRLKLTSVIAGALSSVSRHEVVNALGPLASDVQVIKGRLAFRSFRVVRQRKRALW